MTKVHLYDKILSPLVTEKSTNLSEHNKIVFKVPAKANKKNLKNNIEKIFKVNVTKINIINKQNRTKFTRGRKVKISGYKKAIITLKKGQSIDLTTGISCNGMQLPTLISFFEPFSITSPTLIF